MIFLLILSKNTIIFIKIIETTYINKMMINHAIGKCIVRVIYRRYNPQGDRECDISPCNSKKK